MTTAADPPIVPRPPAAASVLSDNTRRVYGAQWRLFNDWCDLVDLRSLPAEPLTVARYLAVRAGSGSTIATLRLATSAIARVHRWAGHDSPCRDRGVREALQGRGRRLAKPQRQAGALTADVLSVIRLTAPKHRGARGRGMETPAQAAERARFDLVLVAILSDAGLREGGMIQQTVVSLLRLHLMEVEGHASGFAIASDCPPQVAPVRSTNRLAHHRHFHHQDFMPVHLSNFNPGGERRPSTIRNQRLNAQRVNTGGFMTRPSAADAAVILNSDQQPAEALVAPVR